MNGYSDMNDKQIAIELAERLSKKNNMRYYVVQNQSCDCYDIVLQEKINNRRIVHDTKNGKSKHNA